MEDPNAQAAAGAAQIGAQIAGGQPPAGAKGNLKVKFLLAWN